MARESIKSLRAEIEALRLRLAEAEQALEAIRTGQVESLVVEGPDGLRIFSLEGATHSYRILVEAMSEGAATLSEDGTLLYCNARFAQMLNAPLERVMGGALNEWAPENLRTSLDALLWQARDGEARGELILRAQGGQDIPVHLSVSAIHDDGRRVLCLVATDLREQKQNEQVLAEGRLARSVLEQAEDAIVVCDERGRITRQECVAVGAQARPSSQRVDGFTRMVPVDRTFLAELVGQLHIRSCIAWKSWPAALKTLAMVMRIQ